MTFDLASVCVGIIVAFAGFLLGRAAREMPHLMTRRRRHNPGWRNRRPSESDLSAARHADLERLMCSYLHKDVAEGIALGAWKARHGVESPNPQEAKANASDPDL